MIDIITCFCDRDYHLIENFINSIKLSFDYKLTFVDDRADKSKDLSNILKDYNYLKPTQKLGAFEARRYGFEHTDNDFVWFVDIDDEPLDFDFQDTYADICIYNFNVNSKQDTFYEDGFFKNYSSREKYFMWGAWNKIFKRKTLKKVFGSLPFIENLNFLDDVYLCRTFYFFAETVKIDKQVIYNYKCRDRNAYLFKDHPEWVEYLLENCPVYYKGYFNRLLHS